MNGGGCRDCSATDKTVLARFSWPCLIDPRFLFFFLFILLAGGGSGVLCLTSKHLSGHYTSGKSVVDLDPTLTNNDSGL